MFFWGMSVNATALSGKSEMKDGDNKAGKSY